MEQAHNFSPEEIYCIKQLIRKGYQTRSIARTIERDLVEVHEFVKSIYRKEPQSSPHRKIERAEGVPHYDDPRAAEIGSRKLLEALNAYFAKRQEACP